MSIVVSRPFNEAVSGPIGLPTPQIVPQPILNLGEMANQLLAILKTELKDALSEAQVDVDAIAKDIAPVLISAIASGDTKLKAELEAQLVAIAEIHKIRGNAAAWRVVKQVSSIALSAVSVGLSAVTGGILK